MKICRQEESENISNSDTCIVNEYPMDDKDINCAVIVIKGRYPNAGYVSNQICKEMVYIQEGSGNIVFEKESVQLKAGDILLLEPGEKYYWDGGMKMIVSCNPAWFPEQHVLFT